MSTEDLPITRTISVRCIMKVQVVSKPSDGDGKQARAIAIERVRKGKITLNGQPVEVVAWPRTGNG